MAARLAAAGALVAVVCMAAPSRSSAQVPGGTEAAPQATVALVETWPDGRINYELTTTRRASMWTPRFPRLDAFTSPERGDRRPVYAVQFVRTLIGHDIKVEVSVLLGTAQQPGEPVATVVVSPGSRIVVDALKRFGVQPVTLSMVTVAPMTPYLPTAISVSPQIEISNIELLSAPYPGYRITLRNLGHKGVSNVHLQSYRGMDKALSTLKRSDDGRPMMQPGASYSFDMNLTSGSANEFTAPGTWSPLPIDLIDFDSVRWDDGTYDGNPPFPNVDPIIEGESGQRLQLRRIIDALRLTLSERASNPELLTAARAGIEALPSAEPDQLESAQRAMRGMKAAALADIDRFAREAATPHQPADVVQWLTTMAGRYEAWLKRLSPP
jgi:hypothetical protein